MARNRHAAAPAGARGGGICRATPAPPAGCGCGVDRFSEEGDAPRVRNEADDAAPPRISSSRRTGRRRAGSRAPPRRTDTHRGGSAHPIRMHRPFARFLSIPIHAAARRTAARIRKFKHCQGGPISRILYPCARVGNAPALAHRTAAIPLGRGLLRGSSGLPGAVPLRDRSGQLLAPYLALHRAEFASFHPSVAGGLAPP